MSNVLANLVLRRLAPAALIGAVALAAAMPSHGQGPPPRGAALVPPGAVVLRSGATKATVRRRLNARTCARVDSTLPPTSRARALVSGCDVTFTLRHRQMTFAEVKRLIARNGPPASSPAGSAVSSRAKRDHPGVTRAAPLHSRTAPMSIHSGGRGFCQPADVEHSGVCYGNATGDMCGIGGCAFGDARCRHSYKYNRYHVWSQGINCHMLHYHGYVNVQWQGTWSEGGLGPYFDESSGWNFYSGYEFFGNCSCRFNWERVNVDTHGDLWGSGTNTFVATATRGLRATRGSRGEGKLSAGRHAAGSRTPRPPVILLARSRAWESLD